MVAKLPASARSNSRGRPGREFVQGIERGFAVVRSFGSERSSRTIAQVAELTGVTRAVARRYLLTLLKLGYVTQHESDFALAPPILDLGYAYLSANNIVDAATPHMEKLVARLNETCSVSVLDGADVVCVARSAADRRMSINFVVGSRAPAHATSMGRVLLADLSKAELNRYLARNSLRALTRSTVTHAAEFRAVLQGVRTEGWAIADGQQEEGVRSAAVPIFDRRGHVAAALNVDTHAGRVSVQELERAYLPVLLETAADISTVLEQSPETSTRTPTRGRASTGPD